MHEIKTDLKRAIYSLPFLVGSVATAILIMMGAGSNMVFPPDAKKGLMPFYHGQLVLQGLSSNIMLMVVPIICTLPYTTAFLDEFTSGFIKPYIMKCDKSSYIKGKVISAGVSGGLVLMIGIFGTYFLTSLIYKPMEIADPMAISPFGEVFKISLVYFVSGCFWASIGAVFANASMSKYMAYAAPFVLYYVLVMLAERYFKGVYVINPEEWLAPENFWPGGEWGIMLFISMLTVIVMMLNDIVIERRVDNL